MAGPDDRGGFGLDLPDGDDKIRDMLGLIHAILTGDELGQTVILQNADLQDLVQLLATTLAACLTAIARGNTGNPDAAPAALTAEELQAAEAILVAGLSHPGEDLDGLGP